MPEPTNAAQLPGGSVVVDDLKGVAFYAVADPGEEPGGRWEMSLSPCTDSTVDYHLRHGAHVVRVGDAYPPPPTLAADARERLARHLYLQARPDDPYAAAHWHAGDSFVNKEPWRKKADAALAAITGKES